MLGALGALGVLVALVLLPQQGELVLVLLVLRLAGEGHVSIESFTGHGAGGGGGGVVARQARRGAHGLGGANNVDPSSTNHLVIREGRTKCKWLAATSPVLFCSFPHLTFLKLFNTAFLFIIRLSQETVSS